MFKRLAVLAVAALVAASFGVPTAAAQESPYGSFTLTVDKHASYADPFGLAITLTGTYTCSVNFTINPEFSGVGVDVRQTQRDGKRGPVFVTGGSGFGDLVCNGQPQTWTATDVWAGYGGGMQATWKNGRAAVSVNGGASAGDCQPEEECVGVWAWADTFINIH